MLDTPSATLPIDAPPGPWRTRHLLDVDQLSTNEIRACLSLAAEMRELRERETRDERLTGHLVGLAFAEPSTRTRVSFEVAATALGAQVLDLPMAASSATKGESLVDTLHTLERTGIQTLVLRHPASGAPYLAARSTGLRIVNAGDGIHAHPTQALLDALTLEEALGGLNGTVVAIVGDVAHSRVARSDVLLLTRLGATVRLAGPPAWTAGMAGDRVEVHPRLTDALDGADAVMALRVQLERGAGSLADYVAHWRLDEERMRWALPDAPILHPGPTNEGVELTAELANGSRSLIGRQVENGVPVRMAVLALVCGAA